ncbi:MAG: 23S rRNA (pseudouridine(1915)-N(3))-methyltransferase RlmH [Bacillales bacterium]|nr:23S rRNA (pseudouridine(1915)-N(3))-methyltransferase RlmH [Bacillales bacterium]
MINIKLVCVGKIKESFHKEEIGEYLKRLSKYCKINIFEVEEYKIKEESPSLIEQCLIKEGENLLKNIKDDEYLILLDLHGLEMTSERFSEKIDELVSLGKNITFAIGGSYGLSNQVRKRSNVQLKLSEMTFTHQMTRVIILEQIYRAFKIINKETYHK